MGDFWKFMIINAVIGLVMFGCGLWQGYELWGPP